MLVTIVIRNMSKFCWLYQLLNLSIRQKYNLDLDKIEDYKDSESENSLSFFTQENMGFNNFTQNHVMLFTEKHLKLTDLES